MLSSFPQAHQASRNLLEQVLGIKRIERLTERIGAERVAQRDAETRTFEELPLVRKLAAPPGVDVPEAVAVMPDGGRLQLVDENASRDARTHWHEYKAACLKTLHSRSRSDDPCPDVPAMFLQRERIETLTREIGRKSAESEAPAPCESPAPESGPAAEPDGPGYEPPDVLRSDVLATRRRAARFGRMLAARAWSLGMLASPRKAFVGDGSPWIWRLWKQRFKPFGFTAVLDFIHALTYVFAAATAGRSRAEGWEVYARWIAWVWQGEVARVIEELALRQQELGLPVESDGSDGPRRIVSESLTYLQNQSGKMDYPAYRRQGLPITSSHIESTVKLLNQRVKGSEKFWSEAGAEALLQLKADTLCETGRWEAFWRDRPGLATGTRNYSSSKT